MYKHYDNFLEEHVAQLIDFEMKEVKWEYDYDSKPNGTQKHWHVFCGHNIDECNLNGYEFIEPIWNNIKNVDSTLELERAYLNAHAYGIAPHIHTDDGDVTLTHVSDTGLLLTDASGVGTTQLQFGDAGTYIQQITDGNLKAVADGDITLQATDLLVGTAGANARIQALTNDYDLTLHQYDAKEVARVHDGAIVPTAAGTSTSLTAGTGFGHRRRVLTLGSGNDDNYLTLTAADSGSIIYVTPTNAVSLTLPLVGTETGQWVDIIIAANFNKAFTIKTSGQDGADNITLFNVASDASDASDVGGADHDILTFTNALAGSRIQIINCAGGTAEKWHAYVSSMNTIDATIA